jgi:hypothetical protein
VSRELCTKVADLAEHRHNKKQDEVWRELAEAIAALKDSERHLLKAQIAMEQAGWSRYKVADMRRWALACEDATTGSYGFFRVVGALLDYEDPFSSESD